MLATEAKCKLRHPRCRNPVQFFSSSRLVPVVRCWIAHFQARARGELCSHLICSLVAQSSITFTRVPLCNDVLFHALLARVLISALIKLSGEVHECSWLNVAQGTKAFFYVTVTHVSFAQPNRARP